MKTLAYITISLVLFFAACDAQTDPVMQMKVLNAMQNIMGPKAMNIPASEISVECGGVLETVAGVISYKFGEELEEESCVWIVKPGNKANVYFRLIYAGFAASAQINIYNTVASTGQMQLLRQINRASTSVLAHTGPVFYIQLTTNGRRNTNETGFILSFDGYGADSTVGTKYSNYVLSDMGGSLRHPQIGSTYLQNEFSSFALYSKSGRTVSLTVSDVDIPVITTANGICTGDNLNVYQIDSWQLYSRVRYCAEDKSQVTVRTNSSLLVTFNSVNRVIAGRNGFKLDWRFETDPVVPTTTELPQTTIEDCTTDFDASTTTEAIV